MTRFEQVLINRDGLTKQQAARQRQNAAEVISEILGDGGFYDEVEEYMADEFGLEMDYVMDLIL